MPKCVDCNKKEVYLENHACFDCGLIRMAKQREIKKNE